MQNIIDYSQELEKEFLKLYYEYADGKPQNRINHIIDSFWIDLYNLLFKPSEDEKLYNRCNSKVLPYHISDIESILECYIKLCDRYGGTKKIESFALLIGYTRQTFHRWHTYNNNSDSYVITLTDSQLDYENNNTIVYVNYGDRLEKVFYNNLLSENDKGLNNKRYDVHKRLTESIKTENDNDLSNSTVGQVVRANNDIDVGKLYDVKNAIIRDASNKQLETAAQRAQRLGIELKQ